jgi:hypothetical protein
MSREALYRVVVWFVISTTACSAGPDVASSEQVAPFARALTSSAVSFNFVKTADFGTGYNARIDLTNRGPDVIQGWELQLDMPANVTINVSLPQSFWSVSSVPGAENLLQVHQLDPSNVIAVGQTVSVYLYGSYEGTFGFPLRCRAPSTSTPVPCNGSTGTTPDVTAPTAPTNAGILGAGAIVDIFWFPSTDDTAVTAYLVKYETREAPALEIGEVPAAGSDAHFATVSRLVSQTDYIFLVSARDAAGNESPVASTPIATTSAPTMSASFATTNTWPGGGFQGEFRITNTGAVAIDDWRAGFAFTGSFASVWNATLAGAAPSYSLSAPAFDRRLDPGEVAVVGATGTFANPATPPGGFTFASGTPGVRPLIAPRPSPCATVHCPGGTHCVIQPNGFPTCSF